MPTEAQRKKFRERVKKALSDVGMTQKALELQLAITPGTMTRVFGGKKQLDAALLTAIGSALDVDPGALVSGTDWTSLLAGGLLRRGRARCGGDAPEYARGRCGGDAPGRAGSRRGRGACRRFRAPLPRSKEEIFLRLPGASRRRCSGRRGARRCGVVHAAQATLIGEVAREPCGRLATPHEVPDTFCACGGGHRLRGDAVQGSRVGRSGRRDPNRLSGEARRRVRALRLTQEPTGRSVQA